MNKKILVIFILIVVIILTVVIGIITCKSYKNKNTDEEIQKLYEYGNNLEKMDILPNTIVARFNGEQILFREIETARKSINYSIQNGGEEKNAFYEVLVKKLYKELAKKYPDEVQYNLNMEDNLEKTKKAWLYGYGEKDAEEYRKECLAILCIESDEMWLNEDEFLIYLQDISINQMLESKGIQVVFELMLDKPELAHDTILEEKVERYKELQEKQNDLNAQEEMLSSTQDAVQLLTEIRELYVKDLIINSELELCVDKGELSTTVPTIYEENNENKVKTQSNKNKELTPEIQELKTKIEQDEVNYGDTYQTFTYCQNTYKRKPDRIYFKDSDKNGFFLFEKTDEDFDHLLEVSEDRMAYTVMEDYNLYCFTPDSIETMMTSGDTYIIFDYDNKNLSETDSNFNKDIIFRFNQNTRLYRLVTYLSYFKELIPKENLDKEEFATDTNISGFKYMMYDDLHN